MLADFARDMALRQQPAPVTFERGAIHVETPVTVNPGDTHFPEGFVRSETTVQPAEVTIQEGAIRLDAPITVEPANVTIEDGAIRSDDGRPTST